MGLNNLKLEERGNSVEKIIIKYDDGTEEVLTKGMVLTLDEVDGEATMNMKFSKCSGQDLITIAYGFLEMSTQMGLFGNVD